jgi:hypothetical protein
MNDPERWIDGASGNAEIVRLLEASKAAGPTLAEKTALAARLGVATTGAWLTPTIKALLAGGGIAAGVLAYQLVSPTEPASPPPPVAATPTAQPASKPLALAPAQASAPATSDPLPASPEPDAPKNDPPTIREKAREHAPVNPPSEARLLSQARHALSSNPKLALQLIETHKQLYPTGVLAQERDVLKVSALQNLGRLDAASAAEKKFRAEHPESIHHVGQSE